MTPSDPSTSTHPPIDLDNLLGQLLKKYGNRLQVWNTSSGTWCVQIKSNHLDRTKNFNEPLLSTSVIAAIDYQWLPVAPRKPKKLFANGFTIRRTVSKTSSSWDAFYLDEFMFQHLGSKKECQTLIDKFIERSFEAYNNWFRDYGWTLDKTEGVDFEFSDH